MNLKRILTFSARRISFCVIIIACSVSHICQAEIVLRRVPGWSAPVIPSPTNIHIRPADSLHGPLITSVKGHEALVVQPGNVEPIFHFTNDSTAPPFGRALVDNFGEDTSLYLFLSSQNYLTKVISQGLVHNIVLAIQLADPAEIDSIRFSLSISETFFGIEDAANLQVSLMTTGDFDFDGTKEFLIGFDWMDLQGFSSFQTERTLYGNLRVYSRPWDIALTIPAPIYEFTNLESSENVIFSKNYHELCGHGFPEGCQISSGEGFSVWLGFQHLLKVSGATDSSCVSASIASSLELGGDLIQSNGKSEALFKFTNSSCGPFHVMMGIDEDGVLEYLWQKSLLDGRRLFRFAKDRSHSNSLIAMSKSGRRVFQFDAETGQLVDSTSESIPGTPLYWVDMFDDGRSILPVWEGDSIVAYEFDFSTDVLDANVSVLPRLFILSEPHPNPFNPSVSFTVSIAHRSHLELAIYNVLGRKVDELFDAEISAGRHIYSWEGSGFSSGIYFVRAIIDGTESQTKKMILLQ